MQCAFYKREAIVARQPHAVDSTTCVAVKAQFDSEGSKVLYPSSRKHIHSLLKFRRHLQLGGLQLHPYFGKVKMVKHFNQVAVMV